MTKTIHLFYGRMNPITRGHEFIIDSMLANAKREGAKPIILLSHGQSPKYKNPLPVERKKYYIEKLWPDVTVSNTGVNIPSLLNYLAYINLSYIDEELNLRLYCGSDREDEYRELIMRYNKKDSKHGIFSFNKVEIWCMGDDRSPWLNPHSAGIGMAGIKHVSASAARRAVLEDQYETFSKIVPVRMDDKTTRELFEEIKASI